MSPIMLVKQVFKNNLSFFDDILIKEKNGASCVWSVRSLAIQVFNLTKKRISDKS